jgi:hypothetical protein
MHHLDKIWEREGVSPRIFLFLLQKPKGRIRKETNRPDSPFMGRVDRRGHRRPGRPRLREHGIEEGKDFAGRLIGIVRFETV